ncbi:PD-(D/E)XK nuclease family protein [Polaribacter ponticola]|uniref:PD-(D/E)XK nuclease family protein n=1 Tax=Polaribacter ponticola TaxID=2978475 RepID=A0ABT5SAE5_9FLAO|nr:PD-(D/E)XK nuclease family protein [Polaribacter sp. MSW5]MDD7915089.1 PD-(D/E)XK nuclease family protein [Polaribacter sp. MSW5]
MILLASASKLWNTKQGDAISFGNLFHEILSRIKSHEDVGKVVAQYYKQGLINLDQFEVIKEKIVLIVNHIDLKFYFSEFVTVFNEREILDVDNQIIIPDRLVFTDKNEVVVIDYKTGNQSKEHHQQLLRYERVLKSMDFKVKKKLLIYINDKIDVVEV